MTWDHNVSSKQRWLAATAVAALTMSACSSGDDTTADDAPATSSATTIATATEPTDAGATDDPDAGPAIVTTLREQGADPTLFTGVGELITFVAPEFATGEAEPEVAAQAYLEQFATAYGVADPSSRFEVIRSTQTAAGTVIRLSQQLDGLPVFAGEITITVAGEGEIVGVTGVVAPDSDIAEPAIDSSDAAQAAEAATGGRSIDDPELVAYSPAVIATDTASPIPAWNVRIGVEDSGVELEETLIISAVDGAVLMRIPVDMTGENWDLSDNENRVDDEGNNNYDDAVLKFEMRDGVRTEIDTPDADAQATADHFSTTWNYWMDTHGRDGHDGNGGACDIYVHVGINWFNASSNPSCFVRIGDAEPYAQSLDVISHEFAHSVTGQTSGLVYLNQSGALNEHYSDFFAAMADRSDWYIEIADRDMTAPTVDRWSEFRFTTRDSGGVHSNSGIGNLASFLVGDSGTNTHPDTGVSVDGIGRGKTEALWYATLQSLAPMTSYHAWACATVRTAAGMDSLSLDDQESVLQAMLAVELLDLGGDQTTCFWVRSATTPPPNDDAPEPTAPGTTSPQTTAPATTAPDISTTTTTIAECSIVGVWRLQDQAFFDEIARIAGGGPGQIEYYGGDYFMLVSADGTLVSERSEWALRVSSPQGALVTVISSFDTGTWSAEGSSISVEEDASSADVSLFIEVGGALQPVPLGINIPTQTSSVSGTGTYSCENDTLVVTINLPEGLFTAIWDRIG